jgi:hypothetical protein
MTVAGTTHTTHIMVRSRHMSLLQEDLARARLTERLAEAEASRQVRGARARRRQRERAQAAPRIARATSRARLLVGFGRAASTR